MATITEEVSSIPSSAVPAKTKRKNSKAASQDGKKAANAISKNVSGSYLGTNDETNFAVASHVDKTAEQQQEQRTTVEDRSDPLSTERHDNDNSASCNVIKGHLCGWTCSEEGEWNEWLKYLLGPDNNCILPDIYLQNGALSAKGKDTLKKAFPIRHLAVHRDHAPGRDVINLARVANDILLAFDDAQGACMARKYVAISLQITKGMERSQEEIYTQQEAATRESRAALELAHSKIKARVEDNIRSELRGMSDIISSVEAKLSPPPSSTSKKHLPLMTREVYQAISNAADHTGQQLLMGHHWTLRFTTSMALVLLVSNVIICAILYAPTGSPGLRGIISI
ncbi:hypothetical protein V496_00442 [Pseudogymnoascus sp. VKM F-4515 (FW-2607)]|nr:hypothetical protein V496_00442 [Pseudogymnoascus sp. VKM F-4515 (FW-2607)]